MHTEPSPPHKLLMTEVTKLSKSTDLFTEQDKKIVQKVHPGFLIPHFNFEETTAGHGSVVQLSKLSEKQDRRIVALGQPRQHSESKTNLAVYIHIHIHIHVHTYR